VDRSPLNPRWHLVNVEGVGELHLRAMTLGESLLFEDNPAIWLQCIYGGVDPNWKDEQVKAIADALVKLPKPTPRDRELWRQASLSERMEMDARMSDEWGYERRTAWLLEQLVAFRMAGPRAALPWKRRILDRLAEGA